jgi:hypothetical protein
VPTAPDVHEQSRMSSLPLTGMTRRTPDWRTISVCHNGAHLAKAIAARLPQRLERLRWLAWGKGWTLASGWRMGI